MNILFVGYNIPICEKYGFNNDNRIFSLVMLSEFYYYGIGLFIISFNNDVFRFYNTKNNLFEDIFESCQRLDFLHNQNALQYQSLVNDVWILIF